MNVKTHKFINLEYLELMADGDDAMKKIMLEMLLDELPTEVQKMKTLIAEKNWQDLMSVSHKMKSTLSYVGNDAMTKANKEIELITKDNGDYDKLASLMAIVATQFYNVMPELQAECDNL